jgi:hypothetical protein
MRQWIVVGALVGGCDAGLVAESPTPATADVVPCPPRETSDALAKATWGGASVLPKCTTVRAHDPLTFVVDSSEADSAIRYGALVDSDGAVRWKAAVLPYTTPSASIDWSFVDVDGDGYDELVVADVDKQHALTADFITVWSIDVHGPKNELWQAWLGWSADGTNRCGSSYRLVPDGRRTAVEIVGWRDHDPTRDPAPDDYCPKVGRHLYRWNGRYLSEH